MTIRYRCDGSDQPQPNLNAMRKTVISFRIKVNSGLLPEEICREFFEVDKWSGFTGYGLIPGIRKAVKEAPNGTDVGTIFYVENTDGSTHKETVESYDHGKKIVIKIDNFSPPLRRLATHFIEYWEFSKVDKGCQMIRAFALYPRDKISIIPLWIISCFLKKAIALHTNHLTNPKKNLTL